MAARARAALAVGWVGVVCVALGGCGADRIGRMVGSVVGADSGIHHIPVVTEDGDKVALTVRICGPAGAGPFPLAIVNHPGASEQQARDAMAPLACDSPAVRYFVERGYVVVAPLRRGYGDSDQPWADNAGGCASPDYAHAGLAGARDIEAALGWAMTQSFVKPMGAVLFGEGEGGWAEIAFASKPDPRVSRAVVISGAMGGRAAGFDQRTCRPDVLIDAARAFGKTARLRMLWIYPVDDPSLSEELARSLRSAFIAGGDAVTFDEPRAAPPPGGDWLASDAAAAMWRPLTDAFLR